MKVFKFGGASVKDAEGVKNLKKILEITGTQKKLLVISAMGKTTNALEQVVHDYLYTSSYQASLSSVKEYHYQILKDLFPSTEQPAVTKLHSYFDDLENFLVHNKSSQYDFVYDQIVCYGELLSTIIVSEFLQQNGIPNEWMDVRELIKTDSTYRDAQVEWEDTLDLITAAVNRNGLTISQGFLGADSNNFTTTLGREGSDYSAAIFAYCLNATEVTIWKDVPGVLNADPRVFQNPRLLQQISYEEAIELAFYGASVIHPKTLQPLQRKEIPLKVKSFLEPEKDGSTVSKGKKLIPEIPCFIVKKNQVLISLSTLDFSFMVEENISEIFRLFHKYQMKVDLIQNSAISFSVCVDNKFNNLEPLIHHLRARFKVDFQRGVSLYTLRHFDASAIELIEKDKEVLLKQVTKETLQIVAQEQGNDR